MRSDPYQEWRRQMRLECALIGGTLDERAQIAFALRRRGIAVWHDQRQSKKAASFRRALKEANGNTGIIYDLDRYGERLYVNKPWAFRDHERPPLEPYTPPSISRHEFFARARKMLAAGFDREAVRDTLRSPQ